MISLHGGEEHAEEQRAHSDIRRAVRIDPQIGQGVRTSRMRLNGVLICPPVQQDGLPELSCRVLLRVPQNHQRVRTFQ